jgi:hypothetical protein
MIISNSKILVRNAINILQQLMMGDRTTYTMRWPKSTSDIARSHTHVRLIVTPKKLDENLSTLNLAKSRK